MAMTVFKVDPSKAAALQQVTQDDTVSRQSIHTRDAGTLGFEGSHLYVRVQGSDAGVEQAKKLMTEGSIGEPLAGDEADRVSRAIDDQEDQAAQGMGMIFGG